MVRGFALLFVLIAAMQLVQAEPPQEAPGRRPPAWENPDLDPQVAGASVANAGLTLAEDGITNQAPRQGPEDQHRWPNSIEATSQRLWGKEPDVRFDNLVQEGDFLSVRGRHRPSVNSAHEDRMAAKVVEVHSSADRGIDADEAARSVGGPGDDSDPAQSRNLHVPFPGLCLVSIEPQQPDFRGASVVVRNRHHFAIR